MDKRFLDQGLMSFGVMDFWMKEQGLLDDGLLGAGRYRLNVRSSFRIKFEIRNSNLLTRLKTCNG
jgi:hypothetical protein